MSAGGAFPGVLSEAVLDALPVGVAAFGPDRRAIVINAAYCESVGARPGSYPPGTRLEDLLREIAYRGLYGPGDPEAQLAAALAADRTRPQRLSRRRLGGRVHDLHSVPTADGGHVVCAVDVTAVISERDRAQRITRSVASAVATLPTGLAVFAPDGGSGRLILGNPRFVELTGGSIDGLAPGQTFASLIDALQASEEYAAREAQAYLERQRTLDRSVVQSYRRMRPGGGCVDYASSPLPDGGFAITATDVTALVRAEDESRRRAQMLENILDAIPQGVAVYGPDLRAQMVNRAFDVIMRDEQPLLSVGEHLDDIIQRRIDAGDYDAGELARIAEERRTRSHAAPLTRRRRRPNGMSVEVSIAPLPNGGHVRVVSDITPLIAAQEENARRAERMDAMLANIRHGIALYDSQARLVAFNPAAADVLAVPPGAVAIGSAYEELIAGFLARGQYGTGPQAAEFAARELARDYSAPQAYVFDAPSGRTIDVRAQPTPDGGWVSAFTDVTEAKAAELALRRAKEAAEAASEAKSRFLTTMSHELRTPLHTILGFSDALLRDAASPDLARVVEYAGAINQSGRQLLALINSILDVSRLEAGGLELADDAIEVQGLVQSCLRRAAQPAKQAGVILRDPSADPKLAVRGDYRRLAQALDSLLSNAIKFSAPGEAVATGIARDEDGGVRIEVSDTGIGIRPEDLPRAFEPFTQIDSGLSRRFPGAGLGLYVARALAEAHGGAIALNSRPGEGTCAVLTIPSNRVIRAGAAAPVREETSP